MTKTLSKTRNLLKVGNSFMVSIPPEFVKKNKLKAGDKLGVVIDDIMVIVTPTLSKEK